jgi:hypothetical protein
MRLRGFIENKGQITDREGRPRPDVRFVAGASGGAVHLRATGFSMERIARSTEAPTISESRGVAMEDGGRPGVRPHPAEATERVHRIDVEFEGANPAPRIVAEQPSSDYDNYILPNAPPEGIVNVHGYGAVTYRDVYPGVDAVFRERSDPATGNAGYACDFIVHPGADARRIRLHYAGADALQLTEDGTLRMLNSVGPLEQRCTARLWDRDGDDDGDPACPVARRNDAPALRPALRGHELSFEVPERLRDRGFVVTLWGTYYGGENPDQLVNMAVDRDGNICCLGQTESTAGIASSGAHLGEWHGIRTVFTVKFNAAGVRQWGTYFKPWTLYWYEFGGGIACDASGNVGITGSERGPYSLRAFVAAFDPAGGMLWSDSLGTYKLGNVEGMGIAAGGDGSFVVGGMATDDGIATPGAWQSLKRGWCDAFLAKYATSGAKLWVTYFGGETGDAGVDVAVDGSGTIYLLGSTGSGADDVFLAAFSASGTLLWATTYGGRGIEYPERLAVDAAGNILVCGTTMSDDGIVPLGLAPTMYQPIRHGRQDAFIARFAPGGTLLWSSYYGGEEMDFGNDAAWDDSGNALLGGKAQSVAGIATPNAHKAALGGQDDVLLAAFTADGTLTWGTYAGGEGTDAALAVTGMPNNEVLIAGSTGSENDISTAGAHQPSKDGFSDGFLMKLGWTPMHVPCVLNTAALFGPYCPGDSIDVPFYALCSFQPGNVFTAMLSDALGRFTAPTVVGSLAATEPGVIRCIIPRNVPPGTGYRIKVVSTSPVLQAWASAAVFQIYPAPAVAIQGPSFACAGDSVLFRAVGTSITRYQWRRDGADIPGATEDALAILAREGVYSVVAYNRFGCSAESPAALRVNPPIRFEAGEGTTMCRGDTARIGGDATGGSGTFVYSWMPTGGLDSADVARPTASPSITTQYTVTVSDGAGCVAKDTVLVLVHPTPTVALSPEMLLCRGGSLVIGALAQGGVAPYTYHWSPARGLSSTAEAQPTARPDTTTVYHVRVTDARGCSTEDSVRVSLVATTGWLDPRDTVVCRGGTAALRVRVLAGTAPYRYRWSPGARVSDSTAAAPTARIDGTTRFIVTVTDAAGCTAVDSLLVTALPPTRDPLRILGAKTFCMGDSVILTAGGMWTSVRWSTGDTTRSITVRRQGSYWAEGTLASGCGVLSDTVAVLVHPTIEPRIDGPITVCIGEEATYQGRARSGIRWAWSAAGGTIQPHVDPRVVVVLWERAGMGRVELTETADSSGCSGTAWLDVRVDTALTPAITASGPTVFCEGDSVVLDAGSGYATYRWSSGATTRTIVLRGSGAVCVTVTNASGCSGTSDSMRVEVHPWPQPVLTGARRTCRGDTGEYRVPPGSGQTFTWTVTNGRLVSGSGTERIVVLWDSAGTASVAVTQRDARTGCEGTARMDVTVDPLPVPALAPGPFTLCDGDSLTLDAGAGYARYRWSTGDTAQRLVVGRSGTYVVAVTSAAGCTGSSAPVQVTATQIGAARIAGPQSACLGSRSRYRVGSIAGAAYRWSVTGGGAIEGDSTREQLDVRWTANGPARVLVTASIGPCASSDTIDVLIGASLTPSITASGPTSFCRGDSVSLDAGGGYAMYEWSDGGMVLSSLQRIEVTTSGTYTVRVHDSGGCTGSSSITVTVHPLPAPVIAGPSAFCEGDSAVLQATASYAAYAWSDETGVVISRRRSATLHAGGSYSVTVTDANGCTGMSVPHTVTMHPRPAQPAITQSDDTLISTPAASYQWYVGGALLPGATARRLVAAQDGFYAVRITDANGCEAQSPPYSFTRSETATATVALPVLEAAPGERVRIPISLTASQRLQQAGATEFRATIRFDGALLVPAGDTPSGSMDGDDRVITIRNASGILGNPLAELDLLAMLGPVDRTVLHFDSCSFGSAPVRVTRMDGEFRLLVCREGGVRLFASQGRFGIGQNHPNPFNAMTTIDYEVIESGPVHLIVVDMLGRETATLVDALVEPGRYRVVLDATALSSGLYAAVLSTPSQTAYRMMRLVK